MDFESWLETGAGVMGLTIAPEWREGTIAFLAIATAMSEILDTVPLDDGELELAPVFRPASEGGTDA